MKKIITYKGISIVSVVVLVMIGVLVVSLFTVRLQTSNERLAVREEKRSALEDRFHKSASRNKWIGNDGEPEQVGLTLSDISLKERTGSIEWEKAHDLSGTVYFKIESDGTIVYLERISEFPEHSAYPNYFRDAIDSQMN